MTKVLYWLSANWHWLSIALAALVSILNAASRHWSEHAGVKRVLLFVAEVLSILTSAGASTGAGPGPAARLKWPLTSIPPRARERKSAIIVKPPGVGGLGGLLVLLVFLGGCAQTWDKAMATALEGAFVATKATADVALPAYHARCLKIAKDCTANPCPELVACQAERDKVAAALKAALTATSALAPMLPLIKSCVDTVGGANVR